MPATQQDVRVRNAAAAPTMTSSPRRHNESWDQNSPPVCTSACCTPLNRPAMARKISTPPPATSAKDSYSTGTDGYLLQSEDGSAGFPDFGENIDSTTFEQV